MNFEALSLRPTKETYPDPLTRSLIDFDASGRKFSQVRLAFYAFYLLKKVQTRLVTWTLVYPQIQKTSAVSPSDQLTIHIHEKGRQIQRDGGAKNIAEKVQAQRI